MAAVAYGANSSRVARCAGVTAAGVGSGLGPGGAAAAASGAPKRSLKDLLARGALKSLLEPGGTGA